MGLTLQLLPHGVGIWQPVANHGRARVLQAVDARGNCRRGNQNIHFAVPKGFHKAVSILVGRDPCVCLHGGSWVPAYEYGKRLVFPQKSDCKLLVNFIIDLPLYNRMQSR
jgi:hypothetical protein